MSDSDSDSSYTSEPREGEESFTGDVEETNYPDDEGRIYEKKTLDPVILEPIDEKKRLRKLHKLTLEYSIKNPLEHHTLRKALTFIKINQSVFVTKLRTLDRESRINGAGAFGLNLCDWRKLWSIVAPWMDNEPVDHFQTTNGQKFKKFYKEITSEYRDDIFHLLNIDGSETLEPEELKDFLLPLVEGKIVEIFTPLKEDPWQLVERKKLLKLLKVTMEKELTTRQDRTLNCRISDEQLSSLIHILASSDTQILAKQQIGGKVWRLNQKVAISDVTNKDDENAAKSEASKLVFFISTGAANNEHINYGCDKTTFAILKDHLFECGKLLLGNNYTNDEIKYEALEMATDVKEICESIVSEEVYDEFVDRLQYFLDGYRPDDASYEEVGSKQYTARGKYGRRSKANVQHTVKDLYDDIISLAGRRVTEKEFQVAYAEASGVAEIDCPIWGNMNHFFRGLIPKRRFFIHCIKGQSVQTDGLSYLLEYTENKMIQMKLQRHFILYIIFLLMYAMSTQLGTNISGAFYLGLSIDEAVGLEEVGDAADQFFAWTFSDIRNLDEYWDWFGQTMLPFAFDDDHKPGVYTTHHYANKVIGAVKLTQYRAPDVDCEGHKEMLENNLPQACYATGDVRQSTSWETWDVFSGGSVDNSRELDTCIEKSPDTFPRSLKVGVTVTPGSRVTSSVFKYLLEEKMSVSATIIPITSSVAEAELLSGNLDVVFSLWNSTTSGVLNSEISADSSQVGSPTPGIYISASGASLCPRCVVDGIVGLNESIELHQYFSNDGATPPKVAIYAPDNSLDFGGWDDIQKVISDNGLSTMYEGRVPEDVLPAVSHVTYSEQLLKRSRAGESFLFWSFDTDVLLSSVAASRLSLPDSSAYSTVEVHSLYKSDFNTRFPDVYNLIKNMKFTQSDASSIIEDTCGWLTSNTNTWSRWISQGVSKDTTDRSNYYLEKCYGSWSSNDKYSYEKDAAFLKSKAERSAEELIDLFGPKKFGGGFDGANFSHSSAPFTIELENLRISAEAGNVDAEKLYKKLRPWVFQSCDETGGKGLAPYIGIVSSVMNRMQYSCGGYSMLFPISMTQSNALSELEFLKEQNWVDVATRGLMVEFFVHNQNTRQITRMQYMVEVSSSGAFLPSKRIHTFSFFQMSPETFAIGAPGLMAFILLFVFFLRAAIKRIVGKWLTQHQLLKYEAAYNHGKLFPLFHWGCPPRAKGIRLIAAVIRTLFSDIWLVLELIINVLIVITWGFKGWYLSYGISASHILCSDVYPKEYETISDLTWIAASTDGITVVFLSLKTFYFLQTDKDMNLIIRTLRRAGSLIFNLLIICLIVLFGFIFSAWVVFGSLVNSYRDIEHSFQGLFFMIMGEFDFQRLYAARPVFATLFFLLFYVVLIAVLFNLLIGVMSTTFDEVSMEQFDEVTFLRRIAHDPTTAAWPKIGFFSGLQNQSWWTDIKFWCQRVMYMLTFGGSSQQRKIANRNPRIFWKKYRVLLQMLDGMDMQQIFEAALAIYRLSHNLCDRLVPDENDEPVPDENDELVPDENDEVLLEPKSVHDFIAEEVETNRFHFIEHFLVLVPTNVTRTSIVLQWKEILSHHKEWRRKTSKWAKFS